MGLKAKLSADEHGKLEDALKALYVERDGAFVLQVDGMVSQTEFDELEEKLNEFRDNNRKLFNDLKKFEGIDPDTVRTLQADYDKLKRQGVSKADDLQAAINAAVEKATGPLLDKVKAIETERDATKQQLAEKALDDTLWEAGQAAGIKANAKASFLHLAKQCFRFEDGEIVAKRGDQPLYSKQRGRTTEMLTPEEFVTHPDWLLKEADFLYEESKGTGSQHKGGDRTSGSGARVISADNQELLSQNLEAIAEGRVVVNAS